MVGVRPVAAACLAASLRRREKTKTAHAKAQSREDTQSEKPPLFFAAFAYFAPWRETPFLGAGRHPLPPSQTHLPNWARVSPALQRAEKHKNSGNEAKKSLKTKEVAFLYVRKRTQYEHTFEHLRCTFDHKAAALWRTRPAGFGQYGHEMARASRPCRTTVQVGNFVRTNRECYRKQRAEGARASSPLARIRDAGWKPALPGHPGGQKLGAPGGIRTPDLQLRRLPLYPSELQARDCSVAQLLAGEKGGAGQGFSF